MNVNDYAGQEWAMSVAIDAILVERERIVKALEEGPRFYPEDDQTMEQWDGGDWVRLDHAIAIVRGDV